MNTASAAGEAAARAEAEPSGVAVRPVADVGDRVVGGPPVERRFRGDIDGLRAVAIVLVVGYHALVPGFHGGFIGVDIFFVISGFLISRNLLSETGRTGTVALVTFWGKRIRRLVPALGLMVGVVVALAMVILPAFDWPSVADQARAALLYVSNIMFARQATDYFGGDINTSLFLHTWSLGVEEQFYLVWPLLFGGACLLVRRVGDRLLRPVLVGGFAVTLVVSLVLCVRLTDAGSPWAFFGLPSRAWEFAAAGLLAALPVPVWLRNGPARAVAAVGGLVLLGWALAVLDDTTAYPGLWPLLPVGATILIIIAGDTPTGARANPLSAGLDLAPVRALGRVSYSWYLWHWPFILLAVELVEADKRRTRVLAALAALLVAVVAYVGVENRVRFMPMLIRSAPRTFVMGAAVTGVLLVATLGVQQRSERVVADKIAAGEPVRDLGQIRRARSTSSCAQPSTSPSGIGYCLDGDLAGAETIMLIGDSHAGHWQAAFTEAARREHYRLVTRWRSRCPSPAIPISMATGSLLEDPGCAEFRADTLRLVEELRPEAVVVSNSAFYTGALLLGPSATAQDKVDRWEEAEVTHLRELRARGVAVGRVVSTPELPADPIDCLARTATDTDCTVPRATALAPVQAFFDAEARAAAAVGGDIPVLDQTDLLCPQTTCPVVIDDIVVYSDVGHLNQGFTMRQVPAVASFLRDVVT